MDYIWGIINMFSTTKGSRVCRHLSETTTKRVDRMLETRLKCDSHVLKGVLHIVMSLEDVCSIVNALSPATTEKLFDLMYLLFYYD
jgi:hypothetical protein